MSTAEAQADGLVTSMKGVWNDGIVLVVADPRIHVNGRNDSKDKRPQAWGYHIDRSLHPIRGRGLVMLLANRRRA